MTREFDVIAYRNEASARVKSMPPPEGQKYPPGTRVRITEDLGPHMRHFPGAGSCATVLHTYAHAYGGSNTDAYALDIDGSGFSAWYDESQLSACGSARGIRLPYGLTASDCARMARRDAHLCAKLLLLTMERKLKRKVQDEALRALGDANVVANLWRNVDEFAEALANVPFKPLRPEGLAGGPRNKADGT